MLEVAIAIEPLITTISAAMLWGLWRFVNNYWQTGEPFDVPRFLSLMAVSLVAGVAIAITGVPITEAAYSTQVAALTPFVGILDNFLSNALRQYKGGKYDQLYNGFKYIMSVDIDGDGEAEADSAVSDPLIDSERAREKLELQRDMKNQADNWNRDE